MGVTHTGLAIKSVEYNIDIVEGEGLMTSIRQEGYRFAPWRTFSNKLGIVGPGQSEKYPT